MNFEDYDYEESVNKISFRKCHVPSNGNNPNPAKETLKLKVTLSMET